MNVSLNPELEDFVKAKVECGLYTSASEVVREALRLLRERDQLQELKLEELRNNIAEGVAEADAGQLRDGEEVMAEIRQMLRNQREKLDRQET